MLKQTFDDTKGELGMLTINLNAKWERGTGSLSLEIVSISRWLKYAVIK